MAGERIKILCAKMPRNKILELCKKSGLAVDEQELLLSFCEPKVTIENLLLSNTVNYLKKLPVIEEKIFNYICFDDKDFLTYDFLKNNFILQLTHVKK